MTFIPSAAYDPAVLPPSRGHIVYGSLLAGGQGELPKVEGPTRSLRASTGWIPSGLLGWQARPRV